VAIEPGAAGFRMKSYLGARLDQEGFTALAAVVGARMVGLSARSLHGVDFVERAKAWYDPGIGVYRHRPNQHDPVLNADIYGYWDAILGLMLAAQYPEDPELKNQARTAVAAFRRIAHGLGCPKSPNYDILGWDFAEGKPHGRMEPMNRLGNAPSVAWGLLAGYQITGDSDYLDCARATMKWYSENPGRYEVSHVMGPLTAARLNAIAGGEPLNMDSILNAWFGDGDPKRHPWFVTRGTECGGITCDGIDGARLDNGKGFYAFTMGSLQGPGWLAPVVRYQPQYARAIGRYLLNAANSSRLLQGHGLDANHQDHARWKLKADPANLLFYEGLKSSDPSIGHPYAPYATGDPILNGWGTGRGRIDRKDYLALRESWFADTSFNIAPYMGNSVGFLGGIMSLTEVPGILQWDCLATDWFHPPAYPTYLYYNPFDSAKTISLHLDKPCAIYDLTNHRMLAHRAENAFACTIDPDSAAVLIVLPPDPETVVANERVSVHGIVIDYRLPDAVISSAK